MGRHFFSSEAPTPADAVREALGDAERLVVSLRGAGPQVMEIVHLLDEITATLEKLEAGGMDVRVERSRFETIQRRLDRHKGRFLAEAGVAFREAREALQPDRARWWWFVDEAWMQEKKRRLRRVLIAGAAVVLLLVVAGLVYEFVLAPSPEIRRAIRHESQGESLVRDQGDWEAALVEFEAALAQNPSDPDYWVWVGVLRQKLGDAQAAEEAFAAARPLYEKDYQFLLKRAEAYRDVGDLDAAIADADQAILEDPDLGWSYYIRHTIYLARDDLQSALADLEMADELAQESGDVELQAVTRIQMAMVIQLMSASPAATPTPGD